MTEQLTSIGATPVAESFVFGDHFMKLFRVVSLSLFAPLLTDAADAQTQIAAEYSPASYSSAPVAGSYFFSGPNTIAQTFTAQVSGPLVEIGLELSQSFGGAAGAFTVQLISVSAGVPNHGAEAVSLSYSAPISGLTGTVDHGYAAIDFSGSSFSIEAGSTYAIALSSNDGTVQWWASDTGYDGGDIFVSNAGAAYIPLEIEGDLGFKVYVSQIPEPASFSLVASSVVGAFLLLARRRGKKR